MTCTRRVAACRGVGAQARAQAARKGDGGAGALGVRVPVRTAERRGPRDGGGPSGSGLFLPDSFPDLGPCDCVFRLTVDREVPALLMALRGG